MAHFSISNIERFWSKVETSDNCWLWLGNKDKDGYGLFYKDSHRHRAPAVAYEWAYGPVPEGMWVLHRCDNPTCVKPSHLFLGTCIENVADRVKKGRGAYGERNGGGVKMSDEKVVTMRAQYATGAFTFVHLGKLYGVSQHTARRICKRQNWKHVA